MKKLAFIFALAVVSNWVYAVDAPPEKSTGTAPTEKITTPASTEKVAVPIPTETSAETKIPVAKVGVRKPTADVETFWNNLNWDDLSADEQKLWGILGWNAKLWGTSTEVPVSESASWNKLSKEEKAAATSLGYNKKLWNKN